MTDPFVTIYDRIVALLKAEPTLYDATSTDRALIFPKNLIVYSGTQPHPEKLGRRDGDFPELDVDEGPYQDSGYTKWPTFGGTNPGGTCGKREIVQVYQLTLTTRDYRIEPASKLRNAISVALGKSDARLGLPANLVKQWGPITGSPPAKIIKDANGTETNRRQLKLTIPVVVLLNASEVRN